jgi:hypothetical protein
MSLDWNKYKVCSDGAMAIIGKKSGFTVMTKHTC